jgi:hypothetical protein
VGALLKSAWLNLLAAAIGATGAWWLASHIAAVALVREQAAHARDNERHATDLAVISQTAFDAQRRAIAKHDAAALQVAAADAKARQERNKPLLSFQWVVLSRLLHKQDEGRSCTASCSKPHWV